MTGGARENLSVPFGPFAYPSAGGVGGRDVSEEEMLSERSCSRLVADSLGRSRYCEVE